MFFGNEDISEIEDDNDNTNWKEPAFFQKVDCATNELEACDVNVASVAIDPAISQAPLYKDGAIDHHRCIIHIDFDCFYCQVEAIRNPALKNKPFGVYQKQIVVSSNYEARRLGVPKMSTRAEALALCPQMIMVNGEDLTVYRDFSMKMFNILKKFTPFVERIGFDENFVDVTKNIESMGPKLDEDHIVMGHCFGYAGKIDMCLKEISRMEHANACQCGCYLRLAMTSVLADKIRKVLHSELGLTSSAGIAHCKVLAKLIGKTHKPNQQTTILPTYAEEFISAKNVREIPGIGSQCTKELNKMGIETVSQLVTVPKDEFKARFGTKLGDFLFQLSMGHDNSIVNVSSDVPKSISEEESFRKLTNFEDVIKQMKLLIMKLVKRIEKDGRTPRTIKLYVRKHNIQKNLARVSRQASFDPKIFKLGDKEMIRRAILKHVIELFDKIINDRKNFDLAVLNIGFTNFDELNTSNISSFFVRKSSSNEVQVEVPDVEEKEGVEATVNCSPIVVGCGFSSKTACDSIKKDLDGKNCDFTDDEKSLNFSQFSCTCKGTKCLPTIDSIENQCQQRKDVMDRKKTINKSSSHMDLGTCRKATTPKKDCKSLHNLSEGKSDKEVECPAGIDSGVFWELPLNIQSELMQNWKRKEHEVKSSNTKSSPAKKKQKKTLPNTTSKSILDFFTK